MRYLYFVLLNYLLFLIWHFTDSLHYWLFQPLSKIYCLFSSRYCRWISWRLGNINNKPVFWLNRLNRLHLLNWFDYYLLENLLFLTNLFFLLSNYHFSRCIFMFFIFHTRFMFFIFHTRFMFFIFHTRFMFFIFHTITNYIILNSVWMRRLFEF